MSRTDVLDLGRLGLSSGEARRLELETTLAALEFAGQRYDVAPERVPVRLDVSRMTGGGHSLRLRFSAAVRGPCMRCLREVGAHAGEAGGSAVTEVDAREIDQPGGGEELSSPYVEGDELDIAAWARDAYALALPAQVVCREDCAGLCPVCGEDLNTAGPDHTHEPEPDPRWAKLRELRLE